MPVKARCSARLGQVLLIGASMAALAGCGSKGPLFLPPPPVVEDAAAADEPVADDAPEEAVEEAEDAQDDVDGDVEKDPAGDANG